MDAHISSKKQESRRVYKTAHYEYSSSTAGGPSAMPAPSIAGRDVQQNINSLDSLLLDLKHERERSLERAGGELEMKQLARKEGPGWSPACGGLNNSLTPRTKEWRSSPYERCGLCKQTSKTTPQPLLGRMPNERSAAAAVVGLLAAVQSATACAL